MTTLQERIKLVTDSMAEVTAELREVTEDASLDTYEKIDKSAEVSKRLCNLQLCLNTLILALLEQKI